MTRKYDRYGREVRVVNVSGRNYVVRKERVRYTVAIRGRGGKFRGRRSGVPMSDGTRVMRLIRPIDVNRDGVPDLHKGQVIGRVSKYSRDTPSSVAVKVHVSNPSSKAAMKQTQREKFQRIRAMAQQSRRRRFR